nr:AsmA family protein [Sinorhizobium meliloti]
MRRFILSLLGVAALAVAAIAILPSLISSDWVRSELGRQLSAATGSSIAFNGPVNLSAFPYLAVVAEDVTLSAEAEGITAEFAEVSGSVALSSLWSDRLHIKQIALDRPVIVLEEKAADEAAMTADSGHETGSGDPLPALVAFLERSAIESVSIASGTFILRSATNRAYAFGTRHRRRVLAFCIRPHGRTELRDELYHLNPAVAARAPARRCHRYRGSGSGSRAGPDQL